MKLDALKPRPDAAPLAGERMSVRVRGLKLDAEVGVYASEHGRKQPISVDLEAEVSAAAMAPSADLGSAVNYAALAETVRQVVAARHHELLEDLVQDIADVVFADDRVLRLAITIDKLAALDDADAVGVSYERWR
ncbi:dihydroneopterin aldolase [Marinicauda salina]|uniref:7,8-dihydroneopterin aldolase n=1 Tax=Marinicauda salina TaxID=2135793 RepID=A0A2U2BRR4_9PROT|nr:dihydroneopterin aldolase [Marinicauda salina]PWE16685.1 dihydroneopterin aldolase [Marinicauda salina]